MSDASEPPTLESPADALGTAPEYISTIFSERADVAEHYTHLLATTGVSHGLIGPREVPRLWERHVANCGVVEQLIPVGSTVVDVGSGAGLPGLALAIARPDIHVHLVEPLLRRTTWLESTMDELGLTNVTVHRGKANLFHGDLSGGVVTSRAVAHLRELVPWCRPLVDSGGMMLALKGIRAQQEIDESAEVLRSHTVDAVDVVQMSAPGLPTPTTAVRITFEHRDAVSTPGGTRRAGRKKPSTPQRRNKPTRSTSPHRRGDARPG